MYHVTKIFTQQLPNFFGQKWAPASVEKKNSFFNRRIKGSLVYALSHFMRGNGMGWVSFCPILARYEYRGEQRSVTPLLPFSIT